MNKTIDITLKTGDFEIDRAFRIAMGDLAWNHCVQITIKEGEL